MMFLSAIFLMGLVLAPARDGAPPATVTGPTRVPVVVGGRGRAGRGGGARIGGRGIGEGCDGNGIFYEARCISICTSLQRK